MVQYNAKNLATEIPVEINELKKPIVFKKKKLEITKKILKSHMQELRAKKKLEAKAKSGKFSSMDHPKYTPDKLGLIEDKLASIAEESKETLNDILKSRNSL